MIDSLILFGSYLLGASVFILDEIKKYQHLSEVHPDPGITYKKRTFWDKERLNIIQMCLYGVIAVIIVPSLFGGHTFALRRETGDVIWSMPVKTALIPLMIVIGWTGGRMVIAFMGKSKKELYKSVGINE